MNLNFPAYYSEEWGASLGWRAQVASLRKHWVVLENPRDPKGQVTSEGRQNLIRLGESLGEEGGVWVSTSGTEGDPRVRKWIALPWMALEASAHAVNSHLEGSDRDIWMHALPLFHVGGLQILIRALLAGDGVRVEPGLRSDFTWDPEGFCNRTEAVGGTLSALVPTQLYDLVLLKRQAPLSLRAVVIGGAALDPTLAQRACELGWPILPSYGMTETASQIATAPLWRGRSTESGPAPIEFLRHVEVRTQAEGLLQIKGPSLSPLIVKLSEKGEVVSAEDPREGEGFFTSSDRVELKKGDGGAPVTLLSVSRSADSFKRMGEWVSLGRIESQLSALMEKAQNLGEIRDWTVATEPEERGGVRLVLLVVKGALGLSESLIFDLKKKQLDFAPFERLEHVIIGGETLPRSALGKVRKAELVEWIQQTEAGNPGSRVSLR